MKKMIRCLILCLLVSCLLFSGCQILFNGEIVANQPEQKPAEDNTEPTTEPVTEPTEPEKVTVYLVESTAFFDSGSVEYVYDADFNILSYQVLTLDKDVMYSAAFDERDANGMPRSFKTQWPEGYGNEEWTLSWFQDGKIQEAQMNGNFNGYQYAYDEKGDVTEKRSYYQGILEGVTRYEYDGEELIRVYHEDPQGEHVFDCRVENGIIIEKSFSQSAGGYAYFYEYDANGNLVKETGLVEGETVPIQSHTYKAVEVEPERVPFLLAQQKYLLDIT